MDRTEIKWDNVIFGVSSGQLHFLIDAPKELLELMEGCLFEDNSNSLDKFPDVPGVYHCTIKYWFEQGYFEGWRADGESEWDFVPSNIRIIYLSEKEKETESFKTPNDAVVLEKR